ncbi:MAG: 2TM domain-containing protein [Cyanothece sp. SIO1E1]|nr:2TM domain-containing protein [Cyanothece sp. SIO1E1]
MSDRYRQDDVQQILQRAIARQSDTDELSRTQLEEIATELGISVDNLQAAEEEWLAYKDEYKERQAFKLHRYHEFQHHLVQYLIVNTFLVLLNFLTTHTLSWALYVLLAWGLGLALHGWNTLQTQGAKYDAEFQQWRRRRQFKKSLMDLMNRWLRV